MNLLPLIQRPRKSQHFACPLTGVMFKTEEFRSSVNKSQISTLSYASPEIEPRSKLCSTKTQQKLHIATLQQQPIGRKTDLKKMDKTKQYQTIDSSKSKFEEALFSNKPQVKSSRKKQIGFLFPQVEVLPLHLIQKYQDIANFKLKVSLEPYFKMYFPTNISYKNNELMKIVQKYMPLMKEYKVLDQTIIKHKWPQEFWQIKNTEQLLTAINKYDKNSEYWTKYVLILLSLYCIPDKTVRNTSLENLILQINKRILSKHQNYQTDASFILLKEDGTAIQDFIDLQFSTTKLYLLHKTQPQSHYQTYNQFLDKVKNYNDQVKKAGFKNRIKSHFRNEIVPNKCDQQHGSTINYNVNYSKYAKQKNAGLNRAIKLLEQKKQKSRNNLTALSIPTPTYLRPKSKEKLWRQQNVEETQSVINIQKQDFFHFQVNLGKKSFQVQAIEQFKKYHELSKRINNQINEDQIYLNVLQNNHPILKIMAQSKFHSMKLPLIFSILLRKNIKSNFSPITKMKWYSFVEFYIICSKNIQKLIQLEDCFQIVRNFVENYLQIKNQDYFRQQLAAKVFRMSEGDKTSTSLVQEVIWSWLSENGFVKHEAVQKQLLWTFSQRSKIFYLLIISMIFATFKTTPLDLAHQLLL